MLNSVSVIASEKDVVVFATIDETFNARTGDVDQHTECRFFNEKNGTDIGYANVYVSGDHRRITGDYNGRQLVSKFSFLTA